MPAELSRQVGSPALGRAVAEPGEISRNTPPALAFRQSAAFDAIFDGMAATGAFPPLVEVLGADETARDVCEGQSRPTLGFMRVEAATRRMSFDGGVADLRISTFGSESDVESIIDSAHDVYSACATHETPGGEPVSRSVNPFVSLDGTPGLNLITTLGNPAAPDATSQTVTIGDGPHLIEVRITTTGALADATPPDAAQLIDAVEGQL